jgi:NAD(P)-dependent dehydrogenase (short-subunit alcohol dehydrogenase family)
MPTILITGTNRGLGLEFVRQYAAGGWRVHACARRPDEASELAALAAEHDGVTVHRLDVSDLDAPGALAAELADEALDVVLANAGVYGSKARSLDALDWNAWRETLLVNAAAPVALAQAFRAPLARSGGRFVAVTSKMGSIADNGSGGSYAYRASKAALNAQVVSLARDLAGEGIRTCVLHPGWVQTDMGGSSAPLDAETSVAGMRARIEELDEARSGRFWNWDGEELPW